MRDLIAAGTVALSWILSHNLSLDQAPGAYQHFGAREDGRTKIVLNRTQLS